MMSVKLAILGLLKIKILWNTSYDITFSIHGITSIYLSCDSDYIVSMVLWPQIGNCSISKNKRVRIWRKNPIFGGCSLFTFNNLGIALAIGLKFYTSKMVKTKSKKVVGDNSYACRSYSIKTGRAVFLLSPILIWVTVTMTRETLFWFAWKTIFN